MVRDVNPLEARGKKPFMGLKVEVNFGCGPIVFDDLGILELPFKGAYVLPFSKGLLPFLCN